MSDLRKAAQAALDALGGYRREIGLLTGVPDEQPCDAEVAARAALEQQTEPVQEPVAWMVVVDGGTSAYVTDNPTDFVMDNPDYPESAYRALPLYTAPPQRKPLTDAEIQELSQQHKFDSRMEKFVRVIERAHGIGEEE